jgi:hypothetical protein
MTVFNQDTILGGQKQTLLQFGLLVARGGACLLSQKVPQQRFFTQNSDLLKHCS